MMRRPRVKKDSIRTPQLNPTELNSLFNMNGKITPPREAPEAVIPMASPRLLRNQVLTDITPVWKLQLVFHKGRGYVNDTPIAVRIP